MKVALVALAGLTLALAIGLGAHAVSSDSVGLSSAELDSVRTLAPNDSAARQTAPARKRRRARKKAPASPTRTPPATAPVQPAPSPSPSPTRRAEPGDDHGGGGGGEPGDDHGGGGGNSGPGRGGRDD
jgi:hypothetical protein